MKRKKIPGPYYRVRSGIYKIYSLVSEDFYVGKSKNLHQRWCQHAHDLKLGKHPNPELQVVYNRDGDSNLVMELIELVEDINELETREVYWTDLLKPNLNVVDTKLSKNDVEKIRQLNEEKLPLSEIASRFNISVKYLKEILSGYRWGAS